MTAHPSREDLVLHHYGEGDSAELAGHLADCQECRGELAAIRRTLAEVPDDVPERGEDYGALVWQRVQPRLAARRGWRPRRIWLAAAMAASLLAAFLVGRHSAPPPGGTASARPVRERILLVALGEHLQRSQIVLAELVNAPAEGTADMRAEQRHAAALVGENRMYRQAVARSGDSGMSDVLDDLERVLVEVANGPSELSARQLAELRDRIEAKGILFKVRVVGREVKEKSRRVLAEARVP